MPEDIFEGDKKLDTTERTESFGSALKHIGKGFGVLFFKKFYMNLFIVLLLIAASIVLTYNIKPGQMITGQAVLECNVTCPECEECLYDECVCEEQECPELNCDDCQEKTLTEYVYRYMCPDGGIVNKSDGCVELLPETDPERTSTANGISITLDAVYYKEEDDNIRIRQINYTLVNKGSRAINPKVGVKVYEKYTHAVKDAGYLRNFRLDDMLDVNDWVSRAETVNIIIEEDQETVRLELIDTSPDPDEYITAVWGDIDFS